LIIELFKDYCIDIDFDFTMNPTPTRNNLVLRRGDFANLAEALDYAAKGITGYNFYDSTGKLKTVLPYQKLRREARSLARRLLGLGPRRGARLALVADTGPDFVRYFFACQYAGLIPIPLPAPIQLGDRRNYVKLLRRLLAACRAEIAIASEAHLPFLMRAAAGLNLSFFGGTKAFVHLPEDDAQLHQPGPDDLAYLQFTSGSTRFPRGVMIDQKTVMSNLAQLISGVAQFRNKDRVVSWLPFYHDMGLVGMLLAPLAAQVSVDYLSPRLVGTLFVRGPSVMSGYFSDAVATGKMLSGDGWLNTGDLAYRIGKDIVITGREIDQIVVNGRDVWPQDLEALAERQPAVRSGDALAISVPDTNGSNKAVLLIQCRNPEEVQKSDLPGHLRKLIQQRFFIDCTIELVTRRTLPRTTSGKLARSRARKDFLSRIAGRQSYQVSAAAF